MSWRFAFSPSGGIAYHFIARRRASSLWRGFRSSVRGWLKPWLAPEALTESAQRTADEVDLIVFGPSAGWTLPLDLFRPLRVLFVEPDPIAAWLLRRRLHAEGVSQFTIIKRADILPWCAREGVFAEFLGRYPRASILFANVLGQMPLVASRTNGVREEFLLSLRGRRWASYHDLFSGSSHGAGTPRSVRDGDFAQVARDVFTEGEVIDHETEWLGQPELAVWPLTEDALHVIGFVRSDGERR